MRALACALPLTLALAAGAGAQEPEPPPGIAPEGAEGSVPQLPAEPNKAEREALKEAVLKETEAQPGQYKYSPQGRRDPFVSLLVNVTPSEAAKGSRPPGMPGFLIQEMALKGIVKNNTGFIALLLGTDGKSYFAKVGQRFFDGVIIAMDQTTVSFRQEVTDPLSPVKSRDVKKSLYPSEEARQ